MALAGSQGLWKWAAALALLLGGCNETTPDAGGGEASFDGAEYAGQADKVAHGKRLAAMLTCAGCHGQDYAGQDFGSIFPIVEGLWATNISLTMPAMTDRELEVLLRQGKHPSRAEIYVMPSKQSQFLSKSDMAALLAFLRTIPKAGRPSPPLPEGFEAAVAARMPDDYWLWEDPGEARTYHNAAEEVVYYARHRSPVLGSGAQMGQGRAIASVVCSSCHGAALDGRGEPHGSIDAVLAYDAAQFDRLLTQSVARDGRKLTADWGFGHEAFPFTPGERAAVFAFGRALARSRTEQKDTQ